MRKRNSKKRIRNILQKFSLFILLAVLLLNIAPSNVSAATYIPANIDFFIEVPQGSIFRAVKGETFNVTVNISSETPITQGDSIDRSGPDSIINGFYVASAGVGATGLCGTFGCNGFEEETETRATSVPYSQQLTFDTGDSAYPVGERAIWIFPVLDLCEDAGAICTPDVDEPFTNNPGVVSIEIYENEAALLAAAAAAGDTDGNPRIDGDPVFTSTSSSKAGGAVTETITAGLVSAVNIILGAIFAIIRWVAWFLGTTIFVPLLETTLNMEAGQIASGPILTGWNLVRDVVNMFFILFLIVIGFGTILRVESYSYRKLLVNLIIMALLVNFSLVIGRIIIQIADTVQFTFIPQQEIGTTGAVDNTSVVRTIFQSLSTVNVLSITDGFRDFTFSAGESVGVTLSLIFQFLLELGVIVTFGAMAIFMLIRTVALWVLLILSPVAYAFFVLPATSGLSRQWWSTFLKYAIFAPIMAFFLRLTLELYQRGLEIIPGSGAFGAGGADLITRLREMAANGGVSFAQALELGMIYALVLAFLWAGLIVARQMGIFGANAIVRLAQAGVALGAVGGTGLIAGFTSRKVGKAIGVQLSPKRWVDEYKSYRQKKIAEDIQETAEKAKGRAAAGKMFTSFGSPEDFYRKALSWQDIKRFGKNVAHGRINVNAAVSEEFENIRNLRSKADSMVTPEEMRKAVDEEKALKDKKEKLQASFRGNLDLSDKEMEDSINALLRERAEDAKEAAEHGQDELAANIRRETAEMRNAIGRDKANVAFDPNSDLGKKVHEILKTKMDQTDTQLGNIADFKDKAKGNLVSKEQKDKSWQEIFDREKKLDEMRPPIQYEARLSRSALVAEEKKKLAGIDEAQELQSYLVDAIKQKNRYRVMAVMEKMAEDYNDNEFLNLTPKPGGKPGETFESNQKGMKEFRESVLQKELGMDEASSLEFVSKLGYINEKRGHWETARLVGVRNGRHYDYNEPEHAAAALAEIAKQGPREVLRSINRLGYGGEIQKPDGSREFKPSLLGKAILYGLGPALAKSAQMNHMNPNAAGKLSAEVSANVFINSGVPKFVIDSIRRAAPSDRGWDPGEVVGTLKSIEDRLKRAA